MVLADSAGAVRAELDVASFPFPDEQPGTVAIAAVLDAATISAVSTTLFRYAVRLTGRDDLARELVQETWLAALTSFERFEGRSSLLTWLRSILRKKHVDSFRRSRRLVYLDVMPELEAPPDPRERIDDRNAAALALATLASLSPKERRAIVLCDLEGVDRDDAAEVLAVRPGALRVLLHRGHRRLRDALVEAGIEMAP